MRTLAIDTSSEACSVAVFAGAVLVDARHAIIQRGHAEQLLPLIASLADGGRADTILVGCGPGSFTGVRVGIAAARGLALGWGVPVHGFNSLALIAAAAQADRPASPVLAVIEGGHGEFFVQPFDGAGIAAGAMQSMTPADAARLSARFAAGNRAEAWAALRGAGDWAMILPDARHALTIASATCNLPPTPIYGRAPDAVAAEAGPR